MDGGEPRAVAPEGALAIPGRLPDGGLLARSANGSLFRCGLAGGEAKRLPWMLPSDPYLETVGLSGDRRFLIVRRGSVPAHLRRVEIGSGDETAWRTLGPPDRTGAGHVWTVLLSDDGQSYAYTHGLFLQDLFLADGLR